MRMSDWSSDVCSSDLGCAGQVGAAVGKLRQLFAGDPLYYNEEKYEADFAGWYDLGRDREAFVAVAENLAGAEELRHSTAAQPGSVEVQRAPAVPLVPARVNELSSLALVVDALDRLNLPAFLRPQPVCELTSAGLLANTFHEFYFSLGQLESSQNTPPT